MRSPARNQHSGRNVSAPCAENGYLYAASDDGLLAFSLTSAGTRPVWQRNDLDVLESTVTVAHGLVYVITSDGALHAVDAATGQGRR